MRRNGGPADGAAPYYAEGAPDPSVEKFDTALRGKLDDRELRVFAIDVSGVYRWKESDTPHGTVVIEKVWSFKRRHGDWRK